MSLPLFYSWMMTFGAGFYTRQAYVQDRLMCSSCAIISSIHSAEHAYRNSTFVCSIHDFPSSHTINSIKIRFCKPRLLFESGICVGMQLQKCRFYSRATSIRERLLFNGGFYTRLYGICFLLAFVRLPHRSLFS